MKTRKSPSAPEPVVLKSGSVSVTIYSTVNRIYRPNAATGQRELKAEHPQFTLVYFQGSLRKKKKFTSFDAAKKEAEIVLKNLTNGDTEALKLTGADRANYVAATQELRRWREDANLQLAVADYVAAARRLPEHVPLQEVVNFYLKRHPSGLAARTVRQVLDELVKVKSDAGKSDVYLKDLNSRGGRFADAFQVPITSLVGRDIDAYVRDNAIAPRTQNNLRRVITTICKFAMRRGYLPKDFSEMDAVEIATDSDTEIEIFTIEELRKLFAAARPEIIPFLAIGAFAGLRTAELDRLDWSEINITKRFIEIKAAKAKTASRRLAPVTDNLAAWLLPYVQKSGPVAPFARSDKQLFKYLAPKAGLKWKRNGLRHSFISYRLAVIKDIGQVSLEAGNSPQMVFKHYRQLVTEEQGNEWFSVQPASGSNKADVIIPLSSSEAA